MDRLIVVIGGTGSLSHPRRVTVFSCDEPSAALDALASAADVIMKRDDLDVLPHRSDLLLGRALAAEEAPA